MNPTNVVKESVKQKLTSHMAFTKTDTLLEEAFNNDNLYSGVYLFFSFDLVNSTAFKTSYVDKWHKVFTRFYELTQNKLKAYYNDISLWKYIGDEVLLYLRVSKLEQLYDSPLFATKVMNEVSEILYNEIPESKKQLFIKGTLWIASVKYQKPEEIGQISNTYVPKNIPKNIVYLSERTPSWLSGGQNIDFLGPDIDLGFRISKYAQKSKLLISAELAYILNRKSGEINNYQRNERKYEVNNRLKIVSFEKLKGIWNERRYPIIWFSENWDEDAYEYDEHLDSKLVKNILDKKTKEISTIGKIFNDLGKINEIEDIITEIENSTLSNIIKNVRYNIDQERLAEVHCAAICFNNEGKMLIAKRKSDKKRLPGKWEFGCGQLKINQDIKDCLIVNYEADFNIKLFFPNDDLIPLATYSFNIEEENRIVPGILFLAMIEDSSTLISNNHDEVKLISEEDLEKIDPDDCVDNFHKSAKIAFQKFNEYNTTNKSKSEVL
jgi:isopentenyldiphosphate isomerase